MTTARRTSSQANYAHIDATGRRHRGIGAACYILLAGSAGQTEGPVCFLLLSTLENGTHSAYLKT